MTAGSMPDMFVKEMHRFITEAGSGDWIDVYHVVDTESDDLALLSLLVPHEKVSETLDDVSWGFNSPDTLRPGCSKSGSSDVVYHRFGTDEGFEPLVIERRFHGVKPAYLEILEEFRLFHNLYFDKKNNKYFKIEDDGSEHEVIRFSATQISIRAVEMKQFLAIKEMQLALLFDLRRRFTHKLSELDKTERREHVRGSDFHYMYGMADASLSRGSSFVRVLGKKVVAGFAKEDSDIWPYNEHDEDDRQYLEGCGSFASEARARSCNRIDRGWRVYPVGSRGI